MKPRAWNIFCAFCVLAFALGMAVWLRSLFADGPLQLGNSVAELRIGQYVFWINGPGLCISHTFRLAPFVEQVRSWYAPIWPLLVCAIPPLLWWRKRRKNRARGFAVLTASGRG